MLKNGNNLYLKNEWAPALLLFGIVLLKRVLLLNMGLNPEESKDLEGIIKITQGGVAYKDFFWIYGYLGLYVNAFIFKLFNVADLWVPRLVVSVVFACSACFSYKIARLFLSPVSAFIAVLLGSSGLVAREANFIHIFAFFGATVSLWGGLLYIHEEKFENLVVAGLASGLALISKPMPIGVLSAFMLFCLLIYEWAVYKKNILKPALFLFGAVIFFPAVGGIYFFVNDALKESLVSVFPMFSWRGVSPTNYFFIPPVFPFEIFQAASWKDFFSIANEYFQQGVRWWLIATMFIWGACYSLIHLWRDPQIRNYLALLFLSGFVMVFDIQRLLVSGVNQFISMFPAYVILIYLGIEKNNFKFFRRAIQGLVVILFLIYFAYSPILYYKQFKGTGIPLGLKHARGVVVLPYTHGIYTKTVEFIENNTSEEDSIVFAEYDSFFYLFSGRKNLFNEDWYIFTGTTFHPYRAALTNPVEEKLALEDKIIERIKNHLPGLILVPSKYLVPDLIRGSHFLGYVLREWVKCREIGDVSKKSSFENNYTISVFCKKPIGL